MDLLGSPDTFGSPLLLLPSAAAGERPKQYAVRWGMWGEGDERENPHVYVHVPGSVLQRVNFVSQYSAFLALFPGSGSTAPTLCFYGPLAKDKRNGNGLFLVPVTWLVLYYSPVLIHSSTFLCSFLQRRLKSTKCARPNAVGSKQQCRHGWHPEKLQESHSDHLPTVCVKAAAAQKFKATVCSSYCLLSRAAYCRSLLPKILG